MNQAEAEAAVRHFLASQLSPDEVKRSQLYAIGGKLDTNDVITSIKGVVNFNVNAVGDQPQWAFFLDKDPNANWEHAAAYVIVLNSGAIVIQNETAPPAISLTARMRSLMPLTPTSAPT